jgi:predicted TIM-barrel fold metal-dependent hydrolase
MTASEIRVFDADSHLAEVPDLWTSRLPMSKWGDDVPHVVYDERLKRDRWVIGGQKLTSVANWAVAGWNDFPPEHPPTVQDADPGAFEAKPRLQRMDEYGIYCQALYPNLLAFSNHAFLAIKDPQLRLECVRAYNDHLVEFASADPKRFVLLAALPFWDVEESVKEIHRCAANGHHGLLFIAKPHKMGLPRLIDPHWAPIFEAVQELKWSVNFHIGFADFSEAEFKQMLSRNADRRDYARLSAVAMLNNAEAIADVIMSGLCARYPDVKFVSVESGAGWIPSFVENMDWQWKNSGAAKAHPDMELPSYYFERQVYGMFWFEHEAIRRVMDLYPNNLMFETDFPHPTSLSPGPASAAKYPHETVAAVFEGVPEELARKILWDNAARLYHLDS